MGSLVELLGLATLGATSGYLIASFLHRRKSSRVADLARAAAIGSPGRMVVTCDADGASITIRTVDKGGIVTGHVVMAIEEAASLARGLGGMIAYARHRRDVINRPMTKPPAGKVV